MAEPKFFPTKHKSTNVKAIGTCADGHLYIRFNSGAVYRWDGLGALHHDALIDDWAPGRYVTRFLPKGEKVQAPA